MSAAAPQKKKIFSAMRPFMSIAVALGLVVALVFLWLQQGTFAKDTVLIDGRVRVKVEIAATQLTREKGLSGHAPLAEDEGMLFIFDAKDRYGFWMKDMRFPIDILWIADGAIADITVNAAVPIPDQPLPTYAPRVPVDRVLEVPAGFAAKHGLRIGSTVMIEAQK